MLRINLTEKAPTSETLPLDMAKARLKASRANLSDRLWCMSSPFTKSVLWFDCDLL